MGTLLEAQVSFLHVTEDNLLKMSAIQLKSIKAIKTQVYFKALNVEGPILNEISKLANLPTWHRKVARVINSLKILGGPFGKVPSTW